MKTKNTNQEEIILLRGESTQPKKRKKGAGKVLILLAATVLLLGAIFFVLYQRNRTFDSFEVVNTYYFEENGVMSYETYLDNVVRYSKDGITYMNAKGEVVWSSSYQMKMPKVCVNKEYVAAADFNGNEVYLFDSEGLVKNFTTPYNICNVEVSAKGVVAVVLEADEENYIYLYDKTATELVEIKTTIGKNGYPLDIALSEDGIKMVVSYINTESMGINTNLAFYNFGSVGQNENSDRLVGAVKCGESLVPEVKFIDNDTVCAFMDDQIVVYDMKDKPGEKAKIEFNHEPRSVFANEKYIGMITELENQTGSYQLKVYNLEGKERFQTEIDMEYIQIVAGEEELLLLGSNNLLVMDYRGNLKYQGELGFIAKGAVCSGKRYEYIILGENANYQIRLK
ncbi:MAG: hypothetical protein IJA10_01950 [Lachnospiraceae bacterium]|nr:hypothetical protein [Lachnospiraceae bacterium]